MASHVPNWESLDIDPRTMKFSGSMPTSPVTMASPKMKTGPMSPESPSKKRSSASPARSPLPKSAAEKHEDFLASLKFTGPLQTLQARERRLKVVDYDNGGSDFRTPHLELLSTFGPQPVRTLSDRAKFSTQKRWVDEKIRSPGPVYGGPSSLGKQTTSHHATAGGIGFGTSTRGGALKLYANYTA